MPNTKLVDLEIFFEEFTNGYDAETTISRAAKKFFPKPKSMERANDTYYVRQELMMSTIANTVDISASSSSDIIDRAIPVSFRNPDNVKFVLTAKELRDDDKMRDAGRAAAKRLAALVDNLLYTQVANRAGIVIKQTGVMSWDAAAIAEAALVQRGISGPDLKLFLSARDYIPLAKDLGFRAYSSDREKAAYERMQLPDVANFATYRTANQVNIVAVGTVTGTTVDLAQSLTPSSMTGNVPTDNRQMVLNVAGANIANIKVGDCFTIGSGATAVNAVNMMDKSDTGSLQTFRVLSIAGSGANLTMTPAIISSGPYQNVSRNAGASAAITFLNTVTAPANVFWADGSVFLDYGKLEFPSGYGPKVMTSTTEQGVPLIISADFDHLSTVCTVRVHTTFAATVRESEQCGIILTNQT